MAEQDGMALIYCPCPSLEEAKRIGHALLDARLAGCINILPGMASLYEWQGVREEAAEAVMIAKTRIENAAGIRALIEREHPYDMPAILVLPIAGINAGYQDWLVSQME